MRKVSYDILGMHEHNIDSYEAIKDTFLSGENFAAIVHATGTGKTFNALQLMLENPDKKFVFVTPYNSIIEHVKSLMVDVTTKYPEYNFNNVEKDSIIKINELMNKDLLNYNNLYKYGLYISTIVSEIQGIDKRLVNECYNNLYIQNKTDIKIEAKEICELLNRKPGKFLREIFDDLEYKLVNQLLENEKDTLKKYIIENY